MVRNRQSDGDGFDPVAGRGIPRPGEDRVWSDDWLAPTVVEGDESDSAVAPPGGYAIRKVFEPTQLEDGPTDFVDPDGGGEDAVKFGDIIISSALDESLGGDLEPVGSVEVDQIILDGTPPVNGTALGLADGPGEATLFGGQSELGDPGSDLDG